MNENKWKIRARVLAERLFSKALGLPEFNCANCWLQHEKSILNMIEEQNSN